VVLYQRNFTSAQGLLEMTTAIRRAAKRPVLIGIDQEGGTRFSLKAPFTAWPSAAELGQLGDLDAAEQVGRAIATELRAVACNVNFAPMLDLHMNPESPVTKDRSFGADPALVASMGVAFDRGMQSAGVLSCAKHFPGHGDVAVDPHHDLPVFGGTMQRLESAELIPFAAVVAGGVPLVMTAHIHLPQIDPDVPASLSRILLHKVLRQDLRFAGVILADDLGMGAIAKHYGVGDATVRTLKAGTDMAMLCHDWSAVRPAIAAVRAARLEGQFDENEWRLSLERITHACESSEASEPGQSIEILGCDDHRRLAGEIRERLR
jgi:beta-N-acetylhexosaminidase